MGVDIDHARGGGGTDLLVAAAVGVLYRIHLNPRLAGKNYSTIVNVRGKVLKGTLVEGMTMVPLEELQKLGLNTRKEGIGVKVSNGKEWVRLVPFAWSMHSSAGERALRLPAINGNEGLVVPAADVLKALGYRL
ncbi:MAG TPA: hypothetical protein VEX38_05855 [Fimbriimonadaceae bacterium]|nr:hypothetical protein [Fimbriimonadaceae bacterium]